MQGNNFNFDFSQAINNNNTQKPKDNIKLITREIKDVFHFQKLIKKNNLIQKKDSFELEITILKDYIQTPEDI